MPKKTKTEDLLLRIGDVELLTYWEGEGLHRKLKASITKVLPPEALEANPEARNEWSMEEIGALERLCEEARTRAVHSQSIDIRASQAIQASRDEEGGA